MADVSNISNQPNVYGAFDSANRKNIESERIKKEQAELKTESFVEDDLDAKIEELKKIADEIVQEPVVSSSTISRVMRLLMELLPVMQALGMAQAELMTLPNKMAALYTEMLTKAPVVTEEKYPDLSSEKRQELSLQIQNTTETLRNFREYQTDTAKKYQTNVNTTNESVNQLTDILTSILQQLSQLVSTINR